ncbi:hypothetical protein KFL_000850050 [Klebsormidium nitens]|uniref:DNA-directed primase/polymerase protein n=1 Tax=Klebsormidium nitens TaxID=105231 RepID=A0A1Y1HWM0_KLENI|nr:hypothetical protein KFL_000850050 [Klebsormidium nitens]|eukprot:GAQ81589.1 hypothetical protein KFL_000850050 [Klebsormidium nitens]
MASEAGGDAPLSSKQASELLDCYRAGKRARLKASEKTKSSGSGYAAAARSAASVESCRSPVVQNECKPGAAGDAAGDASAALQARCKKSLGGQKFYGKRSTSTQWHALLKQIASANKNFILAEEEARRQRLARAAVWQIFPTQEMAFKFADAHDAQNADADRLAVLTFEDSATGRRRFLVTTLDVFWQRYQRMLPGHQHYYEIIREGCACHLYLDLEYLKGPNPAADAEPLMVALLRLLSTAVQEHLGLALREDALVELDSSTDEKFSRHLIAPLPGHGFKSNAHVGAFIKKFCSHLRAMRDTDPSCAMLFVWKPGEATGAAGEWPSSLLIDEAVYSRNRAFRLPFSSKYGKKARLLPTPRFKCKNLAEREVFFSALICPPGGFHGATLLTVFDEIEVGARPGPARSTVVKASRVAEASPFPAVDAFIQDMATGDDTPARLRNWSLFEERGVLVFNIDNNRYCERIGRQHKSNNVMYVVDFLLAGYYQKCHDPDCRDFRFSIRPLPPHLLPEAFRRTPPAPPHAHASDQDGERQRVAVSQDAEPPPDWWEKVGEIASVFENVDTWDIEKE